MNHSFEIGEINEIGGVIFKPGFQHIKNALLEQYNAENNVSRITGDTYADGQLKGGVDKMREILMFFDNLIRRVKEQEEDKENNNA